MFNVFSKFIVSKWFSPECLFSLKNMVKASAALMQQCIAFITAEIYFPFK